MPISGIAGDTTYLAIPLINRSIPLQTPGSAAELLGVISGEAGTQRG